MWFLWERAVPAIDATLNSIAGRPAPTRCSPQWDFCPKIDLIERLYFNMVLLVEDSACSFFFPN